MQTTVKKPRSKWIKRLAFAAYMLVLSELACRGYWSLRHQVPFFDMRQIFVGRFYPEMRTSGALEASGSPDDGTVDVLILGGSVVTSSFGPIDTLLQKQLEQTTGRPVRVYNCANIALTSLDSRWKYERLGGRHFDLVLVYESINEARLNNCPRSMFRDDYLHASWYHRVAALEKHVELPVLALPYSLEYLLVGALDGPSLGWYLPRHAPANKEWSRELGTDVKTTESYRRNITRILELAQERGATVMLPEYGYHIPDDETLARYQHEKLGHWAAGRMIEGWGSPEGVAAAIEAHNGVVRELAANYGHVLTVNMNALLPHEGDIFVDPCHLSERGCELFVENLRQPLTEWAEGTPVIGREMRKQTTR